MCGGGLEYWQCVGLDQRSCATLSVVSSGMGDCLRAGKLSYYISSYPGQLSLPSPPGSVNEYQLQLGMQSMAHSD